MFVSLILKIITNSIDNIKEVIIYSKENFLTSLFENKQYKTQEQIIKISLVMLGVRLQSL